MSVVPTQRRAFRFTIRTLLVLIAVLAVVLAVYVNGANRQRRAVAKLQELHVSVQYDYQLSRSNEPPGPAWLRDLLGIDYFDNVVDVGGSARIRDKDLAILHEFPRLCMVDLSSWHVSGASLVQLCGLPELAHISLGPFNATDEALAVLGTLTQLNSLSVVCEVPDDDSAPDNRVRGWLTSRSLVSSITSNWKTARYPTREWST
jgi:hypothetical protein